MRPTNLGFRSPKERTAEIGLPVVTHDGRSLPYLKQANHSSLPQSKRFKQYDVAARRTASQVGPGSYILNSLKEWRASGAPVIRPIFGQSNPDPSAYFYIGNQMVYEASFARKSKKLSQDNIKATPYKPRQGSSQTPKKTQNQSNIAEGLKNSPYLTN